MFTEIRFFLSVTLRVLPFCPRPRPDPRWAGIRRLKERREIYRASALEEFASTKTSQIDRVCMYVCEPKLNVVYNQIDQIGKIIHSSLNWKWYLHVSVAARRSRSIPNGKYLFWHNLYIMGGVELVLSIWNSDSDA